MSKRRRYPEFPELDRFTSKREADGAFRFASFEAMFSWRGLLAMGFPVAVSFALAFGIHLSLGLFLIAVAIFPVRHLTTKRVRKILWRKLAEQGVACCRACGYDLTGNLSGVCPECGTKIEAP